MAGKTPGRKKLPKGKKVKLMQAYLNEGEQQKIVKKFGNLTLAARKVVLPMCG